MKTWHIVGLALVLGTGLGISTTLLRLNLGRWDHTGAGIRQSASTPSRLKKPADDRVPQVTVDQDVFEFGVMDSQVSGHHDFVISNTGTALLTLAKGGSSCKCTKFELEKSQLHPGESMTVSMEWKASGDGPIRNTGTIKTNDPERPKLELVVTGQVTTAIRPVPDDYTFTKILAGQSDSTTIYLLGYLPEGFRIERHEFVEPKIAQYFDVKLRRMTADEIAERNRGDTARKPAAEKKPDSPEPPAAEKKPATPEKPGPEKKPAPGEKPAADKTPAPPQKPAAAEKQPATPDTTAAAKPEKPDKEVKSGYVADVTVKAGLPVGTFRQILRFTTNVQTVPVLSVPISGTVVSEDLVVAGADYQSGVLNIDVVSPQQETKRTLQLFATGPHYKAIDFQIQEIYPKDVLSVELSKPVELQSKTGTRTTLTIRIPKGSPQVDCLGTEQAPTGRILLKTGHPSPEASHLLIRVKFAVAG